MWKSFVPRGTVRPNSSAQPRKRSTWNILRDKGRAFPGRMIANPGCCSETILVVETEKQDGADNDRCEQNLTDVIVEDLLVGTGSVAGMFLPLRILRKNRAAFRGYVLFYVHVLTPLVATQNYPCDCNFVFLGSSPISRGKGVYNKGSPSLQLFFAIICRLFRRSTAASLTHVARGDPLSTGWLEIKYSSS